MLLDSFEHAEADFAARLLIDERNEAETVVQRPRRRCARRSSRDIADDSRPASCSGSKPRWRGLKAVLGGDDRERSTRRTRSTKRPSISPKSR